MNNNLEIQKLKLETAIEFLKKIEISEQMAKANLKDHQASKEFRKECIDEYCTLIQEFKANEIIEPFFLE